MTAWKARAGPFKAPPAVPLTAENLVQTDSQLEDTASRREVGSVSVSCPLKYIEVTLMDRNGLAVVGAPCELELQDASGVKGVTNSGGVVRFNGLATDATKAMLKITEDDEGDGPPAYKIEVVPLKDSPVEEAPKEPDEEDVQYYRPDWDKELAPPEES
jgi:hypothetical protein